MCQAFSPSHVCVVTPERLGLCGAVSWLDAKAANELDPEGPTPLLGNTFNAADETLDFVVKPRGDVSGRTGFGIEGTGDSRCVGCELDGTAGTCRI